MEEYGSVDVDDQVASPANEVVVRAATSVGPGFLVIHEADGASFGAVLGQTALNDGDNADVVITLNRDVVDGETLYAMLHIDEGTVGTYEFPGADGPATDANGDVIVPTFIASLDIEYGSVDVDDQVASPANEVVVRSATSVGPGFLVIHEADGASFGAVLGQTALNDGANADVVITLNRDVVDGETLYAMLHIDEGTVGTYEFPGADGPATDANGDVIVPTFIASLDIEYGSVDVDDQVASPANEVVVRAATSVGPGFLVIHEENGGTFGAVLGQTALNDGANADVVITLNRDIVDGETLYAMLHIDEGTVGTYEFPGADGPATDANGDVITPTFIASAPAFGSVVVYNQIAAPATEVVIAAATSVGPGFLVIHEANGNTFGAVLGQTALNDGANVDVVITLNRAIVEGETLYAMLHVDAGVIGTYEFPGADGPAVDANGDVITPTFVASLFGSVEVDAQVAAPANEVLIRRANSVGPGFLVIHEANGNAIGGVLGQTALTAGANTDVVITLDRDIVDGETLYAMLHIDEGVVGTYEFPGADGPATDANSDVITPTFVASMP